MRFNALLIIVCLLAGNVQAERPVRSLLEMRQENLVIQRWDISCGAAALATVLTYDLGYPVSEAQVAKGMLRQTDPMRVKYRGGFSLLDMKRYAAQIGFDSDGYTGMSLENLASRLPMIVPTRLSGYDHFVIVRKITEQHVYIADPAFGNYRISHSRFVDRWLGIGFEVRPRNKGE
ncbi:MAG TPA: C39 family peptidase [Burkholderiaceae bacterium]|nr:C39 family peptidase [Burkholderiaceae bacterium]